MQEGFPFYLMIGIRYAAAASAQPRRTSLTRTPLQVLYYDVFIETETAVAALATEDDLTTLAVRRRLAGPRRKYPGGGGC